MTTEMVVRFFEQRPFEPFSLLLADGRELAIHHVEYVNVGEGALIVWVTHPTDQVEVVDTALIVSLRTIYPSDATNWIR